MIFNDQLVEQSLKIVIAIDSKFLFD